MIMSELLLKYFDKGQRIRILDFFIGERGWGGGYEGKVVDIKVKIT